MSKTRIVQLDRHRLADGGLAIVTRLGLTYNFTRTYNSCEQAPECVLNITEAEAYRLLEDALKRDVLELD